MSKRTSPAGQHLASLLRGWLPAVLWAAAIVLLPRLLETPVQSTLPAPETGWGEMVRYGIHIFEYGVLALLLLRATGSRQRARAGSSEVAAGTWRVYKFVLFMALGYGILDELQQGLMLYREPSLLDFVADGVGVVGALAATRLFPVRLTAVLLGW